MTVEPHAVVDHRQGTADYDDPPPLRKGMPVTIVEDDTQPDLATIGSFRTITLTGAEPPFRLLAQDRRRKKATIAAQSAFAPVQDVSGALGASASINGPFFTVPAGISQLYVTVASDQASIAVLQQVFPDGATLDVGNTPAGLASSAVLNVMPGVRYRIRYANTTAVAQTFISTSRQFLGNGGTVMLARQGQASVGQGYALVGGVTSPATYEGESEVWCIPQAGNPMTLSIMEERKTPRE